MMYQWIATIATLTTAKATLSRFWITRLSTPKFKCTTRMILITSHTRASLKSMFIQLIPVIMSSLCSPLVRYKYILAALRKTGQMCPLLINRTLLKLKIHQSEPCTSQLRKVSFGTKRKFQFQLETKLQIMRRLWPWLRQMGCWIYLRILNRSRKKRNHLSVPRKHRKLGWNKFSGAVILINVAPAKLKILS